MASKKEKRKDNIISATSGLGVGTGTYVGSRMIDISDHSDMTQQRLMAAHKKKGTGVGFRTKPRAMLAKVIYEPKFKFYTLKSQVRKNPPGVLFSKLLTNTEGGITINGPKLYHQYRNTLKDKKNYSKQPHIGKYFPKAMEMTEAFAEVGVKDVSKATDKQLLKGVADIEKKHGKFFYKQKPDFDRNLGHSMLGMYGHSEDIPKGVKRSDITFWDRMRNKSIKYEKAPNLLKDLRKEAPNVLITKDWGTKHKEYRLEMLGDKPTLIHRFGRKKGMKVNLDKELTTAGRAGLNNFITDYKKFLTNKGAYKHLDEVPFVGADIIIPKDGKVKGVELQWNSGFPFHAKKMRHMISKPYGSTGRMAEYITGRISHPKAMALAGTAALATGAGVKLWRRRND